MKKYIILIVLSLCILIGFFSREETRITKLQDQIAELESDKYRDQRDVQELDRIISQCDDMIRHVKSQNEENPQDAKKILDSLELCSEESSSPEENK